MAGSRNNACDTAAPLAGLPVRQALARFEEQSLRSGLWETLVLHRIVHEPFSKSRSKVITSPGELVRRLRLVGGAYRQPKAITSRPGHRRYGSGGIRTIWFALVPVLDF